MSGIRRNKPAGRFGRHGVRLPTRLAPITKPSKALSAVWDAGTPSLELIGKSTPEGDILTPTVSQDQFEGSCKDLLLDLGNGPAQAIIDQNARTLAQRVADETREELARVLERVELVSTKSHILLFKHHMCISLANHAFLARMLDQRSRCPSKGFVYII